MPLLFINLIGALSLFAGTLVGRVLLALGIGYVSYQGIDVLMTGLHNTILSKFNLLPPQALTIAGMLKVGEFINLTFSAIAARNLIDGLAGGKITKMIIK